MTKLTQEEIALTKIVRATFESGKWNVLVSDNEFMIYSVSFEGAEGDSNEVILKNTNDALLEVDKIEPVVLPTPVVREDIIGEAPKA